MAFVHYELVSGHWMGWSHILTLIVTSLFTVYIALRGPIILQSSVEVERIIQPFLCRLNITSEIEPLKWRKR